MEDAISREHKWRPISFAGEVSYGATALSGRGVDGSREEHA